MNFLPQNVDAEKSLLGMLLLDNAAVHSLKALGMQHFSEALNGEIYAAIREAVIEGKNATPITLAGRFDIRYMGELMRNPAQSFMAHDLVHEVVETHRRRELIRACNMAVHQAAEGVDKTVDEIAGELFGGLEKLSESGQQAIRDTDVTEQIFEGIKNKRDPVSTGLSKLDMAMGGGLFPCKSYGFCARKKVGKTILASTISYNLNKQGVKHLFICGEMSAKEIHERMLARYAEAYPSAFRTDFQNSPHFQLKVSNYLRESNKAILYQDAPGLAFDELRQYVSSAVHKHKVQGIILDYWQLVGGKKKNQSTAEHLDDVAQWIANYCRKAGIWSVVMAQINQEGNTRGGEGIRLAFDQVYQIHRDDLSGNEAWLEMMETRYTKWVNIGSKTEHGLWMNEKGPYFEMAGGGSA